MPNTTPPVAASDPIINMDCLMREFVSPVLGAVFVPTPR